MKKKIILMFSVIAIALAAVVVFFATDIFSPNDTAKYKMVNVGGATNQCDCTKRLER
jgi:hypothetical protein